MKVYMYKAFNDGLAYGEEYIAAFASRKDALDALKKDVEEHYGMTLEALHSLVRSDPEYKLDTAEEDYVSIQNDGGDTNFFVVQEICIKPEKAVKTNKHRYEVDIAVTGRYTSSVIAEDAIEARQKANYECQEADFGVLIDIDWTIASVTKSTV